MLDETVLKATEEAANRPYGLSLADVHALIAEVRRLRDACSMLPTIAGEWNDVQKMLTEVPGDFVTQKVEHLISEQRRLRGVVNTLPKTKDGETMWIGMIAYHYDRTTKRAFPVKINSLHHSQTKIYSTEAAALAAKSGVPNG